MSALERHTQGLAPTPHMVLGTGIDGRGIPIGPMVTRMGTGLSMESHSMMRSFKIDLPKMLLGSIFRPRMNHSRDA